MTTETAKPTRAAGGSTLRQRGRTGGASSGGAVRRTGGTGASAGGLWKFYSEDSTGIKIGPVPVLVMSLAFIATVFVLHIWGKYTRSRA